MTTAAAPAEISLYCNRCDVPTVLVRREDGVYLPKNMDYASGSATTPHICRMKP